MWSPVNTYVLLYIYTYCCRPETFEDELNFEQRDRYLFWDRQLILDWAAEPQPDGNKTVMGVFSLSASLLTLDAKYEGTPNFPWTSCE